MTMRNHSKRGRLQLARETVRALDDRALKQAAGATGASFCYACGGPTASCTLCPLDPPEHCSFEDSGCNHTLNKNSNQSRC
jgi:hypothetical protein